VPIAGARARALRVYGGLMPGYHLFQLVSQCAQARRRHLDLPARELRRLLPFRAPVLGQEIRRPLEVLLERLAQVDLDRPVGLGISRQTGQVELTGPVQGMPPALAPGAPRGVLGNEAVLGELTQVPADVAAVLAEPPGQGSGSRWPVEPQRAQDPYPQRMRKAAQAAIVEPLERLGQEPDDRNLARRTVRCRRSYRASA
jgi:hypothetical protein